MMVNCFVIDCPSKYMEHSLPLCMIEAGVHEAGNGIHLYDIYDLAMANTFVRLFVGVLMRILQFYKIFNEANTVLNFKMCLCLKETIQKL